MSKPQRKARGGSVAQMTPPSPYKNKEEEKHHFDRVRAHATCYTNPNYPNRGQGVGCWITRR